MEQQELVSVVIPVFNVELYLRDCLESIVKQTYKNLELILVDDGSTDASLEVAADYLNKTSVNWRIIQQKNSGQAAARNNGIKNSTGEWVICPDSDDYLLSGTIERLINVAKKYNSDCACCSIKRVDIEHLKDSLTLDDKDIYLPIEKARKLFFSRTIKIVAPGTLIKKSLFDKINYEENCPFTEDTHFLWKLFYEIDSLVVVTGDYYNYLQRAGSTMHTLKKDNYLKTSKIFDVLSSELSYRFPDDFYAKRISPRQRLGALHILARCSDYQTFKSAVMEDGYRRGMSKLFFCGNVKVSILSIVYCVSLKTYYKLSNT